jgi:hypothetical protein
VAAAGLAIHGPDCAQLLALATAAGQRRRGHGGALLRGMRGFLHSAGAGLQSLAPRVLSACLRHANWA